MKKGETYLRELISTENLSTNRITYYMVVCGQPRRISKADFDQYKKDADGMHSLLTKSTKTHLRQYGTYTYIM